MESTQNTFNNRSVPINSGLQSMYEADLVISFRNNKYSIIKNRYGLENMNEEMIIEMFSQMLLTSQVKLFSESFKNDLGEAIQNVFEIYNLKFEEIK
jgi:hypothetical protein